MRNERNDSECDPLIPLVPCELFWQDAQPGDTPLLNALSNIGVIQTSLPQSLVPANFQVFDLAKQFLDHTSDAWKAFSNRRVN